MIVPNPDGTYGPGSRGPSALQHRAAEAIRSLKTKYPNLRVEEAHRRAILVRFGGSIAKGVPDFTADVIVAIENPTGAGLYIPSGDRWDRSHPEKHTELVQRANAISAKTFAQGTRLLKHWNRRHEKPICSWNIKALALPLVIQPTSMTAYIRDWLDYAIDELSKGETQDPAGVAGPIRMNKSRTEVILSFREAREIFKRALQLETEGYPILALNQLAKFFRDEEMMPRPNQDDVRAMEAQRIKSMNFGAHAAAATAASTTSLGERVNTRSWSC